MKREAAKAMYKKFCENWKEVVERQNALDDQGNRHRISEHRRNRFSERGDNILGRRPTFKEWWAAVKTPQQAVGATPEEVQEHIENLNWDEDEQ